MVSIQDSQIVVHSDPLEACSYGGTQAILTIQNLIQKIAPNLGDQIDPDLRQALVDLPALCRLSSLPPGIRAQISHGVLADQNFRLSDEVFDWAVFSNSQRCEGVTDFAKNAILARRVLTDSSLTEKDYRRAKEVARDIEFNRGELTPEERMQVQLQNMRLFRELRQGLFFGISSEIAAQYRNPEHKRFSDAGGFAFSISYHTPKTHFYAERLNPIRVPVADSNKLLKHTFWDEKKSCGRISYAQFDIYTDSPGFLLIHNKEFPLAIASFHVDVDGVLVIRQMQQIKPKGRASNHKTLTLGNCYDLGEIDWRRMMIQEGIKPLCQSLGIQTLAIDHRAPIEWGRSSSRISETFDPRIPCRSMRSTAIKLDMEFRSDFKRYESTI